jgi:hypothetical protein
MKRVVFVVLLCLAAACNKKVTASNDFKAAMEEFRPMMKTFTAEFPIHERAVQQLRDTDPAAAAKKIEADIVPLFDRVASSIARAREAGTRYIELAGDEDPAIVAKLRANVLGMEKQRAGFLRVRDLYASQAKKLARGALTATDRTEFNRGVQAAMAIVTSTNGG